MTDIARSQDVADRDQRRRALDPVRSFIVQAPAGSGKTELLIQRYLALLARVGQPEEIAAVTFTRKAAAEMRTRVLEALASARLQARPAEPHRAQTWDLASAALARDRQFGWRLEEGISRLRIQTMDALCASLTRQLPVLSSFGGQPESVDDASELYREAARATLGLLAERHASREDIARLLVHLDNHFGVAEGLLCDMLARRDHWLRLGGALDRSALEAALERVRRDAVARVRRLLPKQVAEELAAPDEDGLEPWLALCEGVLTKKGDPRKRHAAYETLAAQEEVCRALHGLRRLPPGRYSDAQWEVLGAITRLLPLAVAQLKLVFAARGQADFVEISQGALAALGTADEPTDLLLSLDYRIRHILVDEFQDTSLTQFALLERLTAGWSAPEGVESEGRTLFLVGDPMQSIYRFRQAEVALFLRARRFGIGDVGLEPLTLSVNFRSQADLVSWVNASFAQVMPATENIAAGAVPYTPCEPVHPARDEAVRVHAFFDDDGEGEAAQVAALARSALPRGSTAILVRNRNHLEHIIPRLKQAGLRFRAIEIEALSRRPVVQDLFALARALSHPADRIAWLALLRSPCCGLTLADLHALAGGTLSAEKSEAGAHSAQHDLFAQGPAEVPAAHIEYSTREMGTVWDQLGDEARLARLSDDGRYRIERLRRVLEGAQAGRLRATLRDRVEAVWLALGGPAGVENETELEDAERFLDFLERREEAGDIADLASFEEGMQKLYALPDVEAGEDALQVMTIHKSKGLEFDTVIVPGLGRSPRRRDPSLFLWTERPVARADDDPAAPASEFLLAPIKEAGSDNDPAYDYLVWLEQERQRHEDARLLYVAATRARNHLHLLGGTRLVGQPDSAEVEVKAPAAGSLLERLWPAVERAFHEQASLATASAVPAVRGAGGSSRPDQALRRLPRGWSFPALPPDVLWAAPAQTERARDEIEFSWAGIAARHIGSVVHRWLQRIAEDGLEGWNEARVAALRPGFRRELAARGVSEAELGGAEARVASAIAGALADTRGRWLLGPQTDARNEYRLTAVIDGVRRRLVIDRVFTDVHGTPWVVDYKTSQHEGADADVFLDRERARYRGQLERYVLALGSAQAWRRGLYFPLMSAWRQWEQGEQGDTGEKGEKEESGDE
jgi:ATP-dependent exoDNAse (exonuclease V) beta subunit